MRLFHSNIRLVKGVAIAIFQRDLHVGLRHRDRIAALLYPVTMLHRPTSLPNAPSDLIDSAALRGRACGARARSTAATSGSCGRRSRSASRPRSLEGRERAEELLLKDRHGRRCAERLCRLQDEIIRVLFEFAGKHLYPSDNPSEAERMAVVATGGYGRGLLAPGSDIDLLFLLPYKQTAWGE